MSRQTAQQQAVTEAVTALSAWSERHHIALKDSLALAKTCKHPAAVLKKLEEILQSSDNEYLRDPGKGTGAKHEYFMRFLQESHLSWIMPEGFEGVPPTFSNEQDYSEDPQKYLERSDCPYSEITPYSTHAITYRLKSDPKKLYVMMPFNKTVTDSISVGGPQLMSAILRVLYATELLGSNYHAYVTPDKNQLILEFPNVENNAENFFHGDSYQKLLDGEILERTCLEFLIDLLLQLKILHANGMYFFKTPKDTRWAYGEPPGEATELKRIGFVTIQTKKGEKRLAMFLGNDAGNVHRDLAAGSWCVPNDGTYACPNPFSRPMVLQLGGKIVRSHEQADIQAIVKMLFCASLGKRQKEIQLTNHDYVVSLGNALSMTQTPGVPRDQSETANQPEHVLKNMGRINKRPQAQHNKDFIALWKSFLHCKAGNALFLGTDGTPFSEEYIAFIAMLSNPNLGKIPTVDNIFRYLLKNYPRAKEILQERLALLLSQFNMSDVTPNSLLHELQKENKNWFQSVIDFQQKRVSPYSGMITERFLEMMYVRNFGDSEENARHQDLFRRMYTSIYLMLHSAWFGALPLSIKDRLVRKAVEIDNKNLDIDLHNIMAILTQLHESGKLDQNNAGHAELIKTLSTRTQDLVVIRDILFESGAANGTQAVSVEQIQQLLVVGHTERLLNLASLQLSSRVSDIALRNNIIELLKTHSALCTQAVILQLMYRRYDKHQEDIQVFLTRFYASITLFDNVSPALYTQPGVLDRLLSDEQALAINYYDIIKTLSDAKCLNKITLKMVMKIPQEQQDIFSKTLQMIVTESQKTDAQIHLTQQLLEILVTHFDQDWLFLVTRAATQLTLWAGYQEMCAKTTADDFFHYLLRLSLDKTYFHFMYGDYCSMYTQPNRLLYVINCYDRLLYYYRDNPLFVARLRNAGYSFYDSLYTTVANGPTATAAPAPKVARTNATTTQTTYHPRPDDTQPHRLSPVDDGHATNAYGFFPQQEAGDALPQTQSHHAGDSMSAVNACVLFFHDARNARDGRVEKTSSPTSTASSSVDDLTTSQKAEKCASWQRDEEELRSFRTAKIGG